MTRRAEARRSVAMTVAPDNWGTPVSTAQVEDEKFYQDFFAKVDKSLFIEKEKI